MPVEQKPDVIKIDPTDEFKEFQFSVGKIFAKPCTGKCGGCSSCIGNCRGSCGQYNEFDIKVELPATSKNLATSASPNNKPTVK